jgi:hypothetical protein
VRGETASENNFKLRIPTFILARHCITFVTYCNIQKAQVVLSAGFGRGQCRARLGSPPRPRFQDQTFAFLLRFTLRVLGQDKIANVPRASSMSLSNMAWRSLNKRRGQLHATKPQASQPHGHPTGQVALHPTSPWESQPPRAPLCSSLHLICLRRCHCANNDPIKRSCSSTQYVSCCD